MTAASGRFRIGAFQLAVLTPVPSAPRIEHRDQSSAWGPPWGFQTTVTSGDPVEARLLALGVLEGPAVAPTETIVKRVFAAHHQALEGRIVGIERVADAVCDLARRAGLDAIGCAQLPLPEGCHRIEITCKSSSFAYQIDEHANTYTVAAILNAVCLHCGLDRLFSVEDEASIVWGPFAPMLRAYPARDCRLYTMNEELPDDWGEPDDDDDEDDELRDVYPPNALAPADLQAIARGAASVDDVIAHALAAGDAALQATYPGRHFEGLDDDGCLLPTIIFRAVAAAEGLDTLDLASARALDPEAEVDDELVLRVTRGFLPLLERFVPELDLAQVFEIWNTATARALADHYAPRMVEP